MNKLFNIFLKYKVIIITSLLFVLILLGLSALLGIDIWRYLWPIVIILVGLLIIVSALFGRHRRY